MKKVSLTRKELELFALNSLGFHKAALRRMSTLFLGQLLQMRLTGDTALGRMAREVENLEGAGYRDIAVVREGGTGSAITDGWVIFKRHNGTNYYLTLARLDDGDRCIHQRVRDAYDFDFPYLKGN